MPDQIHALQFQSIENQAQLLCAFCQSNRVRTGLMSSIHDHTSGRTESAYLASIDKLKMFKNGSKDERLSLSYINERQVYVADGCALPEGFDVFHIATERVFINVGTGIVSVRAQMLPPAVYDRGDL